MRLMGTWLIKFDATGATEQALSYNLNGDRLSKTVARLKGTWLIKFGRVPADQVLEWFNLPRPLFLVFFSSPFSGI